MKIYTENFTIVLNKHITNTEIDPDEFRVLCYLFMLADDDGICFPSYNKIAEKIGIGETKVKNAIKCLIALEIMFNSESISVGDEIKIIPREIVRKRLENISYEQVYIGNTINLKATTVSHKNKHKIQRPEEEWIRVEGTHEAIIVQKTI